MGAPHDPLSKGEAARLNGQTGGRPRKAHDDSPGFLADPPDALATLPPRVALFVAHYVGDSNFVASDAYKKAGFRPHRENAARLLRRPAVRTAVATLLGTRIDQVAPMGGEEGVRRLSLIGRFDIAEALPADDPIRRWPEALRLCVKSVKPGKFGRTVEFHDPVKAIELMVKIAGRLKDTVKVEHTLEEIMAAANAADDPARVGSDDAALAPA